MSRTLLVCFEANDAAPLAGFAQSLGQPYDVLTLQGAAPEVGAETVFVGAIGAFGPADGLANAIAARANGYSRIAALSSMQSKDVMPRVAAALSAGMITDVVGASSPTAFVRPIVAGTLLATVEPLSPICVFTVRPAGFPAVSGANGASSSVPLDVVSAVKQLARSAGGSARPELTQAKVVVSGGRPLKDSETFEKLIGGLADKLGGAVGATRAAVDSGIAPNELQVGQTGKIVAPDLYIAAGISGSTQHMAGIKDSKVIVAINKDPDAPIFEVADIGIVGDLFDVIPELIAKL